MPPLRSGTGDASLARSPARPGSRKSARHFAERATVLRFDWDRVTPAALTQSPRIEHVWLARRPRFHVHSPDCLVLAQPGRTLVRLPHRSGHPPRRPQKRPSPGSRRPHPDRRPRTIRMEDRRGNPRLRQQISTTNLRSGTSIPLRTRISVRHKPFDLHGLECSICAGSCVRFAAAVRRPSTARRQGSPGRA
jgi:hypothetical protein